MPETLAESSTDERRETLWITDAEMIRRMGCPEKVARQAIVALDRNPRSGFPRKQPLWANRRYWPAVKLWLDRNNGIYPHKSQ